MPSYWYYTYHKKSKGFLDAPPPPPCSNVIKSEDHFFPAVTVEKKIIDRGKVVFAIPISKEEFDLWEEK